MCCGECSDPTRGIWTGNERQSIQEHSTCHCRSISRQSEYAEGQDSPLASRLPSSLKALRDDLLAKPLPGNPGQMRPVRPIHSEKQHLVMRNVSLLDENTLRAVNELVAQHGQILCGHARGERQQGRCDSFVVETDVHYPTDRNLLRDVARVLVRITSAPADDWSLPSWRQADYHGKTLRRLYQRVARSRGPDVWRADVVACLAKCTDLVEKVETTPANLVERDAGAKKLAEPDRYVAHTKCQIEQTDRRILRQEVVSPEEKVFSVFKKHTRWISKGKVGGPAEPAVRVAIVEDQYRFLFEHRILWQESDKAAAVPVIEATQQHFPELFACSYERNFDSPQS